MLADRIMYNYKKNIIPYKERLAYIQSTGTQFIDTGISGGDNGAFELSIIFMSGHSGWTQYFAGTQYIDHMVKLMSSGDGTPFMEYEGTNTWEVSVTRGASTFTKIAVNANGTCYIDNVLQSKTISNTGWGSMTYYLFNGHEENNNFGRAKVAYLKMWKDGTLVRDFIPVLDVDSVPCLYDEVSRTFFYNQGTGTFLYGTL